MFGKTRELQVESCLDCAWPVEVINVHLGRHIMSADSA